MKRSTEIPISTDQHLHGTGDRSKRSFRRLLQIMKLVTINCESALLSTDIDEIGCHLKNTKKYYATMLRHASRYSLTVENIQALELRSARLEAMISKLEERYATRKGRR